MLEFILNDFELRFDKEIIRNRDNLKTNLKLVSLNLEESNKPLNISKYHNGYLLELKIKYVIYLELLKYRF